MDTLVGILAAAAAVVTAIVGFIQGQLVALLFIAIVGSLFVWILRLHFDPRFEKFDLTKMVEQADGSPDAEKIRMWVTYVAGLFAFFWLLFHDRGVWISYAPMFLGIAFTHLVANRMTARPPLQPQPGAP